MSTAKEALRAYLTLISSHRDAWYNVLGNPESEAYLDGCVVARRNHRLASPPPDAEVRLARRRAEEAAGCRDFKPAEQEALGAAVQKVSAAHEEFVEAAKRSHAGGVKEVPVTGARGARTVVPVLNVPLAPQAVDRLAAALEEFEWAVTNAGRVSHEFEPPPPLARRAARYRDEVLQAVAILRGASTAGQAQPDYQAAVDKALKWWQRYLPELTPPPRRTVATMEEAADAGNALLREVEKIAPPPSVDREDMAILRALWKWPGLRMTLHQIATQTQKPRVSHRTVAARMPYLLEVGLVATPCGPKQGYVITPRGQELLERLDALEAQSRPAR